MEEKNKRRLQDFLLLGLLAGMTIGGYFATKDNEISSKNKHELDSLYHAKLDSLKKNYLFEKNALEEWYFRRKI